jgi:hypothetical protein
MSESETMEWEKFREASLFLHAIRTTGQEQFAKIVITMLLNEETVTRQTFTIQVKTFMDIAISRNDNQTYYLLMLASAFAERALQAALIDIQARPYRHGRI